MKAESRFYIAPRLLVLAALLAITIPSITNIRTPLGLFGVQFDLQIVQIVILLLAILVLLFRKKYSIILTVKRLFLILSVVLIYGVVQILVFSTYETGLWAFPLRGIFNFGINVAVAILLDYIIYSRLNMQSFASIVTLYGIVVACSALGEFILLKTSQSMLENWRIFVWGNSVERDEILRAGGVSLVEFGLSRVGGLVGAPENLGFILAMTLPFIILSSFRTVTQIGVLVMYVMTAMVAGSRSLGIALIICSIILSGRRRRFFLTYRKPNVAVMFGSAVGIASAFWFNLNIESLDRYGWEAQSYEWAWRSERLTALLETLEQRELASFMGLGLGWGVEEQFGLHALTSGILGGDFIIAYGLGGLVGLGILAALWRILIDVRKKNTITGGQERLAIDVYLVYLMIVSLYTPQVMMLLFTVSTITVLLLAVPICVERTMLTEGSAGP